MLFFIVYIDSFINLKRREHSIRMKNLNSVTNKLNKLAVVRIKNMKKINYRKYNDKYINFSKKDEDFNLEDE